MSTKKEKCCFNCGIGSDGCTNKDCQCHQSESIEWETVRKEFWSKFNIAYVATRGFAGLGIEICDFFKAKFEQAITTAVAKAGKKAYAEGFEDGCKAH